MDQRTVLLSFNNLAYYRDKGTGLASASFVRNNITDSVRVVRVDQVNSYEWVDQNDTSYLERSADPNVVRHPFMTVQTAEDSFLLLEGAAYFHHLKSLGLEHVPVQICSEDTVELSSGRLVLFGFSLPDLTRLSLVHPDQVIIDENNHPSPPSFVSGKMEFPDRDPITIHFRHSSMSGCPTAMDFLFRTILSKGRYQKGQKSGTRPDTPFRVDEPSAWLTLPAFTLVDMISAASSDRYFPPSVLNLRTPFRIFNIDFPLSVLESDLPREEKEAFLRDLILFREQARRTTYFEGPVYILNR